MLIFCFFFWVFCVRIIEFVKFFCVLNFGNVVFVVECFDSVVNVGVEVVFFVLEWIFFVKKV